MVDLAESNVVVIPDAEPSDKLGLQVHWRLSGFLEQDVVNEALEKINLEKHLFPSVSNDTKYLRRALEQLHDNKRHNLVRRLGDNKSGFSLVFEHSEALDLENEAETEQGDPVESYEIKLTAKIVTDKNNCSHLNITPADHPDADKLRQEFERQRTLYHCGTDLSQWLTTKIIPYCNGLSGRDRGGFYYIPAGEDVKRFEQIMNTLKELSTYGMGNRLLNGFKIYTIPAIAAENMIEAVTDSLIEETDKLCGDLETKINEETIGPRAWEAQRKKALQHENKVKKYAKLLNTEFSDLTGRLQDLQACMGVLQAKLMAEKEQEKSKK